jgi:molybdate transport system substrate-binding protein
MQVNLISLIIILLLQGLASYGQKKVVVQVAAASDLKFALDSIIGNFEKSHRSISVIPSYGSSGKLAEQIMNGAPFQIFFSADISYPEKVRAKGLASSSAFTYGYGKIVLWSRDSSVKSGIEYLRNKALKNIAIANPLHAPYGKRAEEALKYYKLYDLSKQKIVMGENVSQAAQFVYGGAAEVGIIALSLAVSPSMKAVKGYYYVIPQESYTPLQQAYILLGSETTKEVNLFHQFMQSQQAKSILLHFGFSNKP